MMQVMHLQEVPRIEIPLHTLIELVPKPDGKMAEERIKFDLQHESVASYLNQSGNTPLATQDSMLTALTPYASMNMRQVGSFCPLPYVCACLAQLDHSQRAVQGPCTL